MRSSGLFIRLLKGVGSLRVTVLGLFLLLVLTVWGTLYQAEHGLHGAQVRFYQSWFLLVRGVVPFPGAQSVMLLLFANLVASLVERGLRGTLRWGLGITHLGLLIMLAAGGVTFYLGKESQLSLVEGEGSNVAIAYNDWELALLPSPDSANRTTQALDVGSLRVGQTIALPDGRFAIRIDAYYRNAQASREALPQAPVNGLGYTALRAALSGKEGSAEVPGLLFSLLKDGRNLGSYLLWGGDSMGTAMDMEGRSQIVSLRRARLPLPAFIQLQDFKRELHPGSGVAKSYSSRVLVRTGQDSDRTVLISMNKPLRLRGFTFYQSSFASGPGGQELSTLSVVRNYGRLLPYIATGLTVAGMLIHFTGMLVTRLRRRPVTPEVQL